MKFLFVGTDKGRGGAQTHFVTLAKALMAEGHVVEAVARPQSFLAQMFNAESIVCSQAHFHNVLDPRGYVPVWKHMRRFKPDWLVGSFGKEYWPLILLGKASRTPVALFRHTNRRTNWLTRQAIPRLADRFFVVSRFARRELVQAGAPAKHVRISYNLLDPDLYRHNQTQGQMLRRKFAIPQDAQVMGYVGLMSTGKAAFELMQAANKAMQEVPALHGLWVGAGKRLDDVKMLAREAGLAERHHFVGFDAVTAPYYSAFTFLAFPSRMQETFGRVSIEAQAAGIPVLANRIGGIPETMLDGQSGYLLEDNQAAWTRAIVDMCTHADHQQTMGKAGRAFVEKQFSHTAIARDFIAQLETPIG